MSSRASFGLGAWLVPATLWIGCVTSDPVEEGGGVGWNDDSDGSDDADGEGAGVSDGGSTSTLQGAGGAGGGDPCGDGFCAPDESCETCEADCSCDPMCGDGECLAPAENQDNCPEDCGTASVCGDGTCDLDEDCDLCFEDCGVCACVPDPLEPNGGSGSASPATSGVDYCQVSVCSQDVDWFEFEVTSGFTATLTFHQAEGDLDMEIFSEHNNNAYITGSYSHDDDEAVTLNGVLAGTYWARVYGYQMANENPDYCFRVDVD